MTANEIRFYNLEIKMMNKRGATTLEIEEMLDKAPDFYDELCDILFDSATSNENLTISVTQNGKIVKYKDFLPIYTNKQIIFSEEEDIIYNVREFLERYETLLK